MDPVILMSAVSTTAATTLVAAMSTDAWQSVREVLLRALGGDHGPAVIEELDGSAQELNSAVEQDVSALEARIVTDVAGRLKVVMEGSPEVAGRLAQVVAEIIEQIADRMPSQAPAGTQNATASDSAQQAVQFSGQQNNSFTS